MRVAPFAFRFSRTHSQSKCLCTDTITTLCALFSMALGRELQMAEDYTLCTVYSVLCIFFLVREFNLTSTFFQDHVIR